MRERWEFRADGTGLMNAEAFRWRSLAEFEIALCFEEEGEVPCEYAPAQDWATVAYEFVLIEHDAGREIVLRGVGSEGFWWGAPLRYDGA